MKAAAIVLFVLSAMAGLRVVLAIVGGAILLSRPGSELKFEVFFPQSVGMLMVPFGLLIAGLVCWRKAAGARRPPPLP